MSVYPHGTAWLLAIIIAETNRNKLSAPGHSHTLRTRLPAHSTRGAGALQSHHPRGNTKAPGFVAAALKALADHAAQLGTLHAWLGTKTSAYVDSRGARLALKDAVVEQLQRLFAYGAAELVLKVLAALDAAGVAPMLAPSHFAAPCCTSA